MAHSSRKVKWKLFIAIDLGTTFSSVSYARCEVSGSEEETQEMRQNFGLKQIRSIKFEKTNHVATELVWDANKKRWLWGDEVKRAIRKRMVSPESRMRFIKLGLDNSPYTKPMRQPLLKQLRDPAIPAYSVNDLIRIYLKKLWDYTVPKIQETWEESKNAFSSPNWEIETAITVPALWSPSMIDGIKRAAIDAGIQSIPDLLADNEPIIRIVSEPEAAAVLTIQEEMEGRRSGHAMKVNEPFIIVDLGGGTADLITFVASSLRPLRMLEEVQGNGGFCGSEFITECFRQTFQKIFSPHSKELETDTGTTWNEILDKATAEFDKDKKTFFGFVGSETSEDGPANSLQDEFLKIIIDGIKSKPLRRKTRGLNADAYIKNGYVEINRSIVRKCFDKVVAEILELIQQQINLFDARNTDDKSRYIRRVVLVGGLSANPHIKHAIREGLRTTASPDSIAGYDIDLVVPDELAQTIISSGAILRLVKNDEIETRILRSSFGVCWDVPYDQSIHGPLNIKPKESPWVGGLWALGVMHWLFKCGDKVRNHEEVVHRGGWRPIGKDQTKIVCEEILFSSSTENRDSVSHESQDITKMGSIELDISDIDRSKLTIITNPTTGEENYMINYEFRILLDGQVLSYEFLVPRRGQFRKDGRKEINPYMKRARLTCMPGSLQAML
ncbi:MAG: hypothetical protein M1834_005959 [Cirrosporium novae-zelandiae]|nr:MAG: hypothetical protein M1834_005959 [Cirrosporium novae-zelandiae]